LNKFERRIIMATPTKTPQAGKVQVIVTIYTIDNAIVVDPPRFEVSKKHKELTGPSKETAVIGMEYKYTVEIDGYPTLDPIGVVKA
jgi:hypothetical protein